MKKMLVLAALLPLTACGHSGSSADSPDLVKTYSICVSNADAGVKGRFKLISGEIHILGAADRADMQALGCVFNQLDTPDSLMSDIEVATAQSGSSSLDDGGLHYAWSVQVDGIVSSYPALHMNITKS